MQPGTNLDSPASKHLGYKHCVCVPAFIPFPSLREWISWLLLVLDRPRRSSSPRDSVYIWSGLHHSCPTDLTAMATFYKDKGLPNRGNNASLEASCSLIHFLTDFLSYTYFSGPFKGRGPLNVSNNDFCCNCFMISNLSLSDIIDALHN